MQTVTSFPAVAVTREDLSRILADYLALDRARIMRRLLVTRCGLFALLAGYIGAIIPGLSPFTRWFPIALFLSPPAWAWIHELRLERRLTHELDGIDGAVTHPLAVAASTAPPAGSHQKS